MPQPPNWNTGDIIYNTRHHIFGHYTGFWYVGKMIDIDNDMNVKQVASRQEWVRIILEDEAIEEFWALKDCEHRGKIRSLTLAQQREH